MEMTNTKKLTATHSVPSGMGGTFGVAILTKSKDETMSKVAVCDSNTFKGYTFWVETSHLTPIKK